MVVYLHGNQNLTCSRTTNRVLAWHRLARSMVKSAIPYTARHIPVLMRRFTMTRTSIEIKAEQKERAKGQVRFSPWQGDRSLNPLHLADAMELPNVPYKHLVYCFNMIVLA
ncbi:hypothetical protein HBH46_148960 [Parastagonospora nodorum]|nr:hypothetical protein HBH46_148960 [Parastagonospora nodorum]